MRNSKNITILFILSIIISTNYSQSSSNFSQFFLQDYSYNSSLIGTDDNSWNVNLIHRKDIINALTILLENPRPGIFNLCYPAHPTKSDYYSEISRELFQTQLEFDLQGSGKMINGSKFASTFKYEYQF